MGSYSFSTACSFRVLPLQVPRKLDPLPARRAPLGEGVRAGTVQPPPQARAGSGLRDEKRCLVVSSSMHGNALFMGLR